MALSMALPDHRSHHLEAAVSGAGQEELDRPARSALRHPE